MSGTSSSITRHPGQTPLSESQLVRLQRADHDQQSIDDVADIVRHEPNVNADAIVAFAAQGVAAGTIGSAIQTWHDAGLDESDSPTKPESLIMLAVLMGVSPTEIKLPKGDILLGGATVSLKKAMDEDLNDLAASLGLDLGETAQALPGKSTDVALQSAQAPPEQLTEAAQAASDEVVQISTTASEQMFETVVEFVRDLIDEEALVEDRDPFQVFIQVALGRYGDLRIAYQVITAESDETETFTQALKLAFGGSEGGQSFLRPKVDEDEDLEGHLDDLDESLEEMQERERDHDDDDEE